LVETLVASGLEVHDHGDLSHQVWHPDRAHRFAQNVEEVTESLVELADRLFPLVNRGDLLLVLGGNCTIALGVLAALHRLEAGSPVLLYVDRDYDMNTPKSTTDGTLDWMGMAHALDLPGCINALIDALGHRPLLSPDRVSWVGVDARRATEWERQQADRLGLKVITSDELAADPVGSADEALSYLPVGPLAVHLDVDVFDFIDAPLAENADGRNSGPSLDQGTQALAQAARDHRMRALSIGELNPTRCVGDPDAIPRFVKAVAEVLAAR
jgi:arginase